MGKKETCSLRARGSLGQGEENSAVTAGGCQYSVLSVGSEALSPASAERIVAAAVFWKNPSVSWKCRAVIRSANAIASLSGACGSNERRERTSRNEPRKKNLEIGDA